jgi:hypothetical protein
LFLLEREGEGERVHFAWKQAVHSIISKRKERLKLSRREICAANFLPPCEKVLPTYNQKIQFRIATPKVH